MEQRSHLPCTLAPPEDHSVAIQSQCINHLGWTSSCTCYVFLGEWIQFLGNTSHTEHGPSSCGPLSSRCLSIPLHTQGWHQQRWAGSAPTDVLCWSSLCSDLSKSTFFHWLWERDDKQQGDQNSSSASQRQGWLRKYWDLTGVKTLKQSFKLALSNYVKKYVYLLLLAGQYVHDLQKTQGEKKLISFVGKAVKKKKKKKRKKKTIHVPYVWVVLRISKMFLK